MTNPDDSDDGPTNEYKPHKPIPREESGEDIYEKPTLRLKEQPNDKGDSRKNNMRES